jgi:hypothetical protein
VPGGQVEQADGLVTDRVPDGRAETGEVGQAVGVVLVADDRDRAVALQSGADAVGTHLALGVGEAGSEVDLVKLSLQCRVVGGSAENDAVQIGEDHAHRFAAQEVGQLVQLRPCDLDQWGVEVRAADIPHLDSVGRHVPVLASPPGVEDRRSHVYGGALLGGEEMRTGLRHQALCGHAVPSWVLHRSPGP